MRAIDLAFKDISQVVRDRRSLLFLLVMPVLFTFFFGMLFGDPSSETDARLQIGIVDEDAGSLLGSALVDLVSASDTVRPVVLVEKDAHDIDAQVQKGAFAGVIHIPTGYSEALLRGEQPRLEVILDEQTEQGQTARRAVQTSVMRLLGIVQSAQLSAQAYETQAGFASPADRDAYLKDAVQRALAAWKVTPLSVKITGPVVEDSGPLAENPYNQFSPGMMVQFAVFGLIQAAVVLVIERKTGAMARLMTTPMRKGELIGGHLLGMFVLFFAQQLILVLFGQLFLHVDYLRQPLATLLLMIALSLWVASLGLLIATLARKEEQVILGAMVAMFLTAALGGAWFPLEVSGKMFSAIGHLTPGAWAMDGFQNILLRGLDLQSVLLPVGILLAYTLAFFGVSVWRFKFE